VIAPGDSPGTINTGNLTLDANSTYNVSLDGPDTTRHDLLNVTGTVNIAAGANLVGSAAYTAIPGDEIVIIQNDGTDPVVGKFAQGDVVSFGTQNFIIDYNCDANGDGANNDVALIRYGAALAADPCDPSKLALFVSATTGNDLIRFIPVAGNNQIHVLMNTDDLGSFSPTGLMIGFGQAGNDTISVEVPTRSSWLYGQAGNDMLIAGNGNSVLIGGNGNDTLKASNGNDILIGGSGADPIISGNGNDLLIAGATKYDNNNTTNRRAICAIQNEWTMGTGGLVGHVSHLNNGGGLNGNVVLNASTLFEDNSVDTLTSGSGKDWLLLNTAQDTSNATPIDVVTNI